MVRAILDGRKTQTRRVVKKIPCACGVWDPTETPAIDERGHYMEGHSGVWWCECCLSDPIKCPYGKPGDRLWVRETWGRLDINGTVEYRADENPKSVGVWRPSIHMPRWASRITLEITGIRVERLQDISEDDARAEGVTAIPLPGGKRCYVAEFSNLWESINGDGSWNLNPWVWVVEFRKF